MRTVSKRIIVVEDVDQFMQRTRTLLNRQEFNVLTVRSGDEALFRARNDKPDLLILNFFMPEVNGYTVCRKLKGDSATEQVPVLIIAAHSDEEEDPGMVTEAAGCDGCIEKPIQYENLVPAVEKLLGIPPRRHERVDVTAPCFLTDEDGKRSGTILNLTPEGVFVETRPAPWAGDIVEMELSPGDTATPFRLKVAVRWSREADGPHPAGGGCEFIDTPPELMPWVEENISAAAHSQGKT